jgi:hypothetical protein
MALPVKLLNTPAVSKINWTNGVAFIGCRVRPRSEGRDAGGNRDGNRPDLAARNNRFPQLVHGLTGAEVNYLYVLLALAAVAATVIAAFLIALRTARKQGEAEQQVEDLEAEASGDAEADVVQGQMDQAIIDRTTNAEDRLERGDV